MRPVTRDQLAHFPQEFRFVVVFQTDAQGDALLGDLLAAPVHGGEQQLEQAIALARRHVGDHAEIEHGQATVLGHPQVARVRVRVDLAMHEHLVQIAAQQILRQRGHVLLGTSQSGNLVHPTPVGQLHGQHTLGRVIPHGGRHPQLPERRQMLAEALQVLRLGDVVQLGRQRAGELPEPLGETHVASDIGEPIRGACDAAQQFQVRHQQLRHAGPLHLDRDLASIAQSRPVDLRQGRTPQRHLLEAGIGPIDPNTQRVFHLLPDHVEGNRRDILLHALQRGRIGRRHQVRTRGQHLAQLHERRAERLELIGELFGTSIIVAALVEHRGLQREAVEYARFPVAEQEAQDRGPARQFAFDGRGGSWGHGVSTRSFLQAMFFACMR